MWPFVKKVGQTKPKNEEEKPKQDIELRLACDPGKKHLTIKPREPEPLAKQSEPVLVEKPESPTELKQVCPTCGKPLVKSIKNRHKCPYCKNWIYFLGDRPVTKEDHERLAEGSYQARHEERLRQAMGEELAGIGLSEDMLNHREQQLLIKTGVKPKRSAVIMSLFNEIITGVKGFNEREQRYHDLATILNKGGEECFHIIQCAARAKLCALKIEGLKKVSILASRNCETCKKLDGKVMSIEEAEKTLPIPIKECTNHPHNEKQSFCVCSFEPEYDDEYWKNHK